MGTRTNLFEALMSNARAKAFFSEQLGINMFRAAHTFRMIDTDNSGFLDRDEFVIGCLRLQGGASAVDIEMNLRETRRIKKDISRLSVLVTRLMRLVKGLRYAGTASDIQTSPIMCQDILTL